MQFGWMAAVVVRSRPDSRKEVSKLHVERLPANDFSNTPVHLRSCCRSRSRGGRDGSRGSRRCCWGSGRGSGCYLGAFGCFGRRLSWQAPDVSYKYWMTQPCENKCKSTHDQTHYLPEAGAICAPLKLFDGTAMTRDPAAFSCEHYTTANCCASIAQSCSKQCSPGTQPRSGF